MYMSGLETSYVEKGDSVPNYSNFQDTRTDPPALATLVSLYVARTYHCWKEPELLPWLQRQHWSLKLHTLQTMAMHFNNCSQPFSSLAINAKYSACSSITTKHIHNTGSTLRHKGLLLWVALQPR